MRLSEIDSTVSTKVRAKISKRSESKCRLQRDPLRNSKILVAFLGSVKSQCSKFKQAEALKKTMFGKKSSRKWRWKMETLTSDLESQFTETQAFHMKKWWRSIINSELRLRTFEWNYSKQSKSLGFINKVLDDEIKKNAEVTLKIYYRNTLCYYPL